MAYKGFFKPKNPKKYAGDPNQIVYRSLWELKYMNWLDSHPDVIEWSSEEIVIPYLSPIDSSYHRYFPDFKVKIRDKNGVVETLIVEIKPASQMKEPEVQKRKTRKYIQEVYTWGVNSAKWDAAEKYCKSRGWKFVKYNEYNLGIKPWPKQK